MELPTTAILGNITSIVRVAIVLFGLSPFKVGDQGSGPVESLDEDDGWIVVDREVNEEEPKRRPSNPGIGLQCMGIAGIWWSSFYFGFVWFGVELLNIHYEFTEAGSYLPNSSSRGMAPPAAWDRRLVQTSAGHGQEIFLLRKAVEPGYWLASTAEDGIVRVKIADRQVVRTELQGARMGVVYSPYAAISLLRKNAMMAEAEVVHQGGTAGIRILTHAPVGLQMTMRRYGAAMVAIPAMSLRSVRWCLRSPSRVGAMVGVAWITYEALKLYGVLSWCRARVTSVYQGGVKLKETLIGSYQAAADAWAMATAAYDAVEVVITPWKVPAGMIVLYVVMGVFADADDRDSPTSSAGNSGHHTPTTPETPGDDSDQSTMQTHLNTAVQTAMMVSLAERLLNLEKNTLSHGAASLGGGVVQDGSATVPAAPDGMLSWQAMDERLQSYEKIIHEDQAVPRESKEMTTPVKSVPKTKAKAKTMAPRALNVTTLDEAISAVEITRAAGGVDAEAVEEEGDTGDAARPFGEADYPVSLGRSEEPLQVFIRAVEEFRPEDETLWAEEFPVGFRERRAAVILGALYTNANGATLKVWGKSWLKGKGLDHCADARRILKYCSALDAIILEDRMPGAINLCTTERLARQVQGLVDAFKDVRKRSDWEPPDSLSDEEIDPRFLPKESDCSVMAAIRAKAYAMPFWTSKVNTEAWIKVDPVKADYEKESKAEQPEKEAGRRAVKPTQSSSEEIKAVTGQRIEPLEENVTGEV